MSETTTVDQVNQGRKQRAGKAGKNIVRKAGAFGAVLAVGLGGVVVGAELPNNKQMSTIQLDNEGVGEKLEQQGVVRISGLVLNKGFGFAPNTLTFTTELDGGQPATCEGTYSVDSSHAATLGDITCSVIVVKGPEGQ